MLAPRRTLAQCVFLTENQACPSLRRATANYLHDQQRAQRFFSACRASWRRNTKPTDRFGVRGKPDISNRRMPRADPDVIRRTYSERSEQDVRRQVSRQNVTAMLIQRLKTQANREAGTEFSSLANEVARHYQGGDDRRDAEFGHLFQVFHQSYIDQGEAGLDIQIKYALHGHLANQRMAQATVEEQTKLADLRYPIEWYPATRMVQRTIHLHVGPTNSGKTYHALKRLEQAKTGIYAGPLRLLAHEVYTRLNAQGKRCHLITGDDRRINKEADEDTDTMISCTVEMVPINTPVEVAVVDEIQMIGHDERGWAWSQALLGLKAAELHLCGEARTVPLIRELAAAMGDKLVLHHYERLSPLEVASKSLHGDLKQLRKGDCLVVFSRKEIHSLKSDIERSTSKRVAIVYGSLPPETRARQAMLFNDPSNDYDYLVASDAIGMGLNLDIKRIIFESTFKYNGKNFVPISVPHLKQIAGRAGRYRIAPPAKTPESPISTDGNVGDGLVSTPSTKPSARPSSTTVGLVTTLEQLDFPRIRRAMQTEAEPVMSAGIFPPTSVLIKFAAYFAPGTPFSYILQRLHELSSLHPRYHLCDLKDQIVIADMIEPVKNLTIEDRIIFCASPAAVRLPAFGSVVVAFAQCVADSSRFPSHLLEIPNLPLEILDGKAVKDRSYLAQLETLHKALILYIWLSYRFQGVFTTQQMAFYVKGMVEERIDEVLAQVSSTRKQKLKSLRQLAMLDELGGNIGTREDGQEHRIEKPKQTMGRGLYFSMEEAKMGERNINHVEQSEGDEEEIYHLPETEPTLGWEQNPESLGHDHGENDRPQAALGEAN